MKLLNLIKKKLFKKQLYRNESCAESDYCTEKQGQEETHASFEVV